jgi:hypothetical protein
LDSPLHRAEPALLRKLVTALRRERANTVRRARPRGVPLEDRVPLVAAYWRTNLTMRQLDPLFGISKSVAARIIDQLGPLLAIQQRKRFRRDTVLIVDGTLVPTRDHTIAEPSKNFRYSTNHQVVIDADTRRVVVIGRPLPGNRNDCRAWEESGAKAAVGRTTTIADGGYPGTGLLMPHRRRSSEELPVWKQAHNRSHKRVRARVEHTFARMKTWKILRDCRLRATASATPCSVSPACTTSVSPDKRTTRGLRLGATPQVSSDPSEHRATPLKASGVRPTGCTPDTASPGGERQDCPAAARSRARCSRPWARRAHLGRSAGHGCPGTRPESGRAVRPS